MLQRSVEHQGVKLAVPFQMVLEICLELLLKKRLQNIICHNSWFYMIPRKKNFTRLLFTFSHQIYHFFSDGGWLLDSNGGGWLLDSNGGGWLLDSNDGGWLLDSNNGGWLLDSNDHEIFSQLFFRQF